MSLFGTGPQCDMLLDNFDFELPPELIAQYPLEERDQSRLLCYDKSSAKLEHKNFKDIVELLEAGDVLVRNNSQVMPARFYVSNDKASKIEILLVEAKNTEKTLWKVMAKPGKKLKDQAEYEIAGDLKLKVERDEKNILVRFTSFDDYQKTINEHAEMPIPPYMKREAEALDKERYQTIYAEAKDSGASIAAPTAGLHFTDEIVTRLKDKGVEISDLTLHVGMGTFTPIKTDQVENHKMHSEFYEIDEKVWQKIQDAKKTGKRVIAVGSTSTRVLESVAQSNKLNGATDIYIYPGFEFQVVDAMITNFHLPKSSLFLMVAAFLGLDEIREIYLNAIQEKYRFYSYGDACFFES